MSPDAVALSRFFPDHPLDVSVVLAIYAVSKMIGLNCVVLRSGSGMKLVGRY